MEIRISLTHSGRRLLSLRNSHCGLLHTVSGPGCPALAQPRILRPNGPPHCGEIPRPRCACAFAGRGDANLRRPHPHTPLRRQGPAIPGGLCGPRARPAAGDCEDKTSAILLVESCPLHMQVHIHAFSRHALFTGRYHAAQDYLAAGRKESLIYSCSRMTNERPH